VKNVFAACQGRELPFELSSANSINIGRLAPQITYYFKAYRDLLDAGKIKLGDEVNFSVPTGNFGDILAGYLAKLLGLPVGMLICASNANNVLEDFINTGTYDKRRPLHKTESPSMDILVSSNLERLLYLLSGDTAMVAGLMRQLNTDGVYTVPAALLEKIQSQFWGFHCGDVRAHVNIGRCWENHHYLMDTHTAVAYKVYKDYVAETGDETPAVLASTASAFKFAEAVGSALGLPKAENGFRAVEALEAATGVSVPYGLKDLDKKEVKHTGVVTIEEMPGVVLEVK
jgi:threonine synthase